MGVLKHVVPAQQRSFKGLGVMSQTLLNLRLDHFQLPPEAVAIVAVTARTCIRCLLPGARPLWRPITHHVKTWSQVQMAGPQAAFR